MTTDGEVLRAIARHEAAHCVAAWYSGKVELRFTTIDGPPTRGENPTSYYFQPGKTFYEHISGRRDHGAIASDAYCTLIPYCDEQFFERQKITQGSESTPLDWLQAIDTLKRFDDPEVLRLQEIVEQAIARHGDDEHAAGVEIIERLRPDLLGILNAPGIKQAILAVENALFDAKTLSGREVVELIEKSFLAHGIPLPTHCAPSVVHPDEPALINNESRLGRVGDLLIQAVISLSGVADDPLLVECEDIRRELDELFWRLRNTTRQVVGQLREARKQTVQQHIDSQGIVACPDQENGTAA